MQTTLDLDSDVLLAVKQLASRRGISVGQAASELLRERLSQAHSARMRNGVPLLGRATADPLTMELVNQRRDA
jgi:hypothetical protein